MSIFEACAAKPQQNVYERGEINTVSRRQSLSKESRRPSGLWTCTQVLPRLAWKCCSLGRFVSSLGLLQGKVQISRGSTCERDVGGRGQERGARKQIVHAELGGHDGGFCARRTLAGMGREENRRERQKRRQENTKIRYQNTDDTWAARIGTCII